MLALAPFGCASQKPAAPARSATNPADDYLVYALNTKKAFSDNWHLTPNFIAPDGSNTRVKAQVQIAKDGTVESAKIVEPSGIQQLDDSVQHALDSVKQVQPFGAGVTNEQRTFVLDFELKLRSQ